MAREAGPLPPDFQRLKALLVGPEADELARVSAKLDGLDRYVGDAPRLEAATAEIIAQALRRAEVARHRELANAIAPLIVSVIRSEIKNSKDMMVEALYPITGRLVAAAVANAFRDLVANLNERLDKLTSTDGLKLRLRAALQGKPVSELALAEAQQARITRILFLERGSGTLVASWQLDGGAPEQGDLVSGLIAAITEFASSALGEQGGQLRTLDLGASRVILRSSPRMIIAANCEGELRPPQEAALDAAFLRLLERHEDGDGDTEDILGEVAASISAPGAAKKKPGKALYVLGALALGALLWWGGSAWLAARQASQLHAAFNAALAEDKELAAYPLRVDAGAAGDVKVSGLAPDLERVDAIAARLRPLAFPRDIKVNVARVAPFDKQAEQDSGLRALAARAAQAERQGETTRRQARDDLAALDKRVAELRLALNLGISELSADLSAGQAQAVSEAAGLRRQLDGNDQKLSQNTAALRAPIDVLQADAARAAARLNDLAAQADKLRSAADSLAAGLAETNAAQARAAAQLAAGAGEAETLRARVGQLETALAQAVSRLPSPGARLRESLARSVIYFARETEFENAQQALASLGEIAELAKASGLRLRVIGHSDAVGDVTKNLQLALKRATFIAEMLAARGVDQKNISPASRGSAEAVAGASGAAQALNRRVTFEIAEGE